MIKKIIYSILTITVMQTACLFAHNLTCAPELRNSLEAIQKLDEGKQLIADVLKEGPLRIVVASSRVPIQFGACWDPDRRIIHVSVAAQRDRGELIGSIIFELHNALNSYKFDNLDHLASTGKIDKRAYVREIERVEYGNSIAAAKFARQGIEKGLFPRNAQLPVYRSFDEHFYYQQVGGHSAVIARNYDSMAL